MKCNLCGNNQITELGNLGIQPNSVTSEPNLCSLAAKIYFCEQCNHLQKAHTETELVAIEAIYKEYNIYHLSGGEEQLVFRESGSARPRTYDAIERCRSLLAKKGKLLDIGTGNGAVLKSASQLLPEWSLFAFDLGDHYKDQILTIPNVVDFYCGDFQNLPKDKFDLIILWHVLEHLANPGELLLKLKDLLTDEGFLLIQVPDIYRTPFDMAVIDHCSHFHKNRLIKFCHTQEFTLVTDGENWTNNCLTLLLKKAIDLETSSSEPVDSWRANQYFDWLNNTIAYFEKSTQNGNYGLFGTTIAGCWVYGQLTKKPILFVDEDRKKIGNKIDNIPIVMPSDIPKEIKIVMPFIHDNGKNISLKIKKLYPECNSVNFILSPPFDHREP